jgi:quinol monooxygenase YgiN
MAAPFSTLTEMRAKPGREAELATALREIAAPSRAEPGCGRYDVSQSLEDPTVFVVVATWASQEALADHIDLRHSARFVERAGDVLAGSYETVEIAIVGPIGGNCGRTR